MPKSQMPTNESSTPSVDRVDPVERVIAGYRQVIEILAAARTPELPDSSVTMAQLKVLMLLAVRGESRMSDFAPQLGVSLSTVSSHVDHLVDAGLARRREDERDRRNVLVSLTEAGAALLDSFQELGLRELRELLGQLDESGVRSVSEAIDLLVAAAQRLALEDQP
jgi:DNA-binding MarR family transcriptional regulator